MTRLNHAELVGRTFGLLTCVALDYVPDRLGRHIPYLRCRCECRRSVAVRPTFLVTGRRVFCHAARHPGVVIPPLVEPTIRYDAIWIEWKGARRLLMDVCHEVGMDKMTARSRHSNGWNPERIFSTPIKRHQRRRKHLASAGSTGYIALDNVMESGQ